ncbi:hypothetical protein A8924_0266 [Saccharopolyspora erythraea NRRL 2338]|uniref:Uncharacterized protein n=2 Tax=Saccharopolyspora erythraea TaxID=1836 RepID=A4FQW4_SACEN|nr:hypothetical protein N599_13320 [Saccharopolyspora erythraea D]PFG93041.1 hypothetical protein A8924_0266 [Saccharopolyspora erythraea NRRL 2338]CAM06439.1 hypothetical protein SACE_7281 [Saccharopolyspora erythraea NRRL 2338]
MFVPVGGLGHAGGMSTPAASTSSDPLSAVLGSVARHAATQFRDRNLVVRNRGTVHAVAWTRWMGGHELPAPACHVGVAGWAVEDIHPTRDPVTCKLCLRRTTGAPPATDAETAGQLALELT